MSGWALILCLAVGAESAPTCDRERALEVGQERATRDGLSVAALEPDVRGPYDWRAFSTEQPAFARALGETIREFLERREFFLVRLKPRPEPNVLRFGGGHFSFVDATTCEVLFSRPEK